MLHVLKAETIGMRFIKRGFTTKRIVWLMNEAIARTCRYRFIDRDVQFLRKMAGFKAPVKYHQYRKEEQRSFCGVLHQELKRVKKDADVDSLFLDKRFLSEVVEDLDRCYDAPILEDVKKRVEIKKRKLQKARR